MSLASIPTAIEALRAGRPVIVADDEGRENEGDVVIAAELASQEWIAWMVRVSSGFICAPMTNEIADKLALPPMVEHNQDPRGTAYTVSVDAADRLSTGISAADRSHTLRVLANPESTPASLFRPGHILPLRAVDGGVRVNLERAAQVGDRLGGHIVQGHIDGTAEVISIEDGAAWRVVRLTLAPELAPLVARKGSIAVDGVSLTVSDVGRDWFEVSLIPETLAATTLGAAAPGTRVNIETDILARHVARLNEFEVATIGTTGRSES